MVPNIERIVLYFSFQYAETILYKHFWKINKPH